MMRSTKRKYKTFYDISVSLGDEQIDLPLPGIPPFSREMIFTREHGGAIELSKLVMTPHAGTHIDAPSHFIPNGRSIDEYPVQEFILPAHVVNIADQEVIRPSELENVSIKRGDAILFKTDNSMSGRCKSGVPSDNYVYLSLEAADFCIKKKVGLAGFDYIRPERPGESIEVAPIHSKLLGNNILILEGINLGEVPPGRYTLFCLPLKIKGGEASPVRAILKPYTGEA
ncbi:MAG: cyclase family protein [Thermodesulfobacteriota bacterium]|jgi:arylformamidase